MTPKKWTKSRTIRLNTVLAGLSATLAALEVVMGAGVPLSLTTAVAALAAGINVYLRLDTRTAIQPIRITGPVAQVAEGGVTFTGPTTITGEIAGHDLTDRPAPSTPLEDS